MIAIVIFGTLYAFCIVVLAVVFVMGRPERSGPAPHRAAGPEARTRRRVPDVMLSSPRLPPAAS